MAVPNIRHFVSLLLAFGGAALVLQPAMALAGPAAETVVEAPAGTVEGVAGNGIASFKGIPYAAPPGAPSPHASPSAAKRSRGGGPGATNAHAAGAPGKDFLGQDSRFWSYLGHKTVTFGWLK